MQETHEFNELIGFTLSKFGHKANYRVLFLNPNEWTHYHFEYELYKAFMNSQLEWYDNFMKNENPEYFQERFDRENTISENNQIEYGEEKSLNKILNGPDALFIKLIHCHEFNGLIPLRLIENEISIFLKIHKMIDDIDFIILLRNHIKRITPENKFKLVAHEAYHIVESIEETNHEYEFVNEMASKIVGEFKQSQIQKISKL